MAKGKVEHHIDECIGCGACVGVCEKFWVMNDEEMKSHIIGGKKVDDREEIEIDSDEDIKCNLEAAEVCPVNCIHVFVDGNKKI